MGRPRKVKEDSVEEVVVVDTANLEEVEPQETEMEQYNTRLFPDWEFKPGAPVRKATVRTQTEFCLSAVDGVDKTNVVAWGWQSVLDFAAKIEAMSEGHLRITLDIPPHIRQALENAK